MHRGIIVQSSDSVFEVGYFIRSAGYYKRKQAVFFSPGLLKSPLASHFRAVISIQRDTQHLIETIGKNGIFYGACDPSVGRSVKSDYTAIIVLLKDTRTKILYVIAADLIQCAPDAAIQRIIQYAGMSQFVQFAVESNNFQELMVDDLRRRLRQKGHKIKVLALRHNSQKQARICSLEPYVTQGLVRFSKKHTELLSQLTQFPMAKNDDGPDALEMAVEIARKRRIVACAGIDAIIKYRSQM